MKSAGWISARRWPILIGRKKKGQCGPTNNPRYGANAALVRFMVVRRKKKELGGHLSRKKKRKKKRRKGGGILDYGKEGMPIDQRVPKASIEAVEEGEEKGVRGISSI